jgi:hypothetical protein
MLPIDDLAIETPEHSPDARFGRSAWSVRF